MKYFMLFSFVLFCSSSVFSQFNWESQLGFSRLNHSSMNGVSFTNNLRYYLNDKSSLFVGGHFNYSEGNRNIEITSDKIYSFEYDDYVPPFQPIVGRSFNFEYWKSLEIKTSTTYQLTSAIGYGYQFLIGQKELTLDAGCFFTYVNKNYIASLVENTELYWIFTNEHIQYDLAIPFHQRYYDIGAFVRMNALLFENANISVGVSTAFYLPINSKSWIDGGLILKFNI